MYKIGEFSKMSEIPVSTLRWYDEINLLNPEYVDLDSGYRYYTDNNIEVLNKIIKLKRVGFSLEEIVVYKDHIEESDIDDKLQELYNEQLNIESKIEELLVMKEDLIKSKKDIKILSLTKNNPYVH